MKLTQKQEWFVGRYLRDAGAALDGLPASARERALDQVKARVMDALKERAPGDGALPDGDVLAVVRDLGDPALLARRYIAEPARGGRLALSTADVRWLGVCGGLAAYLGMDVRWVRLAVLALGATGPLALIGYLVLYFEMYLTSTDPATPRINKVRLVLHTLVAMAAAVGLHIGARLVEHGVRAGYARFAGAGPLPALGPWDWLHANGSFLLFCALIVTLPLAILSALPMPNDWDATLKRVTQALLAVYMLAICLGLGAFFAGVIINVAQAFPL